MYNGYNNNYNAYNNVQYAAANQPTLRPNYSIDQVIDRVHAVAGSVNELTHVVS